MTLFYERTETSDEVLVTYKPYYLYLLFGMLAIYALPESWFGTGMLAPVKSAAWLALLALIIGRFVTMWRINAEVRRAMKDGAVQMSGSIYSFSRPLTARIRKGSGTS